MRVMETDHVVMTPDGRTIAVERHRLGAMPEIIQHGYVIEPNDVAALTACINRLLEAPDLKNSLAERAYAAAHNWRSFSWRWRVRLCSGLNSRTSIRSG